MSSREQVFDSPEAAAMDGFPPAHCRVVASASEGDHGFVVLDTGAPGPPYLYAVAVWRRDGKWYESGSGNALACTITDHDRELWTLAEWDYAPPDADSVRVEFRGEVREVPVAHGAYLTVWWRQPLPTDEWPRATAFRIRGEWVPARAYRF
jgi:hypothetical protein